MMMISNKELKEIEGLTTPLIDFLIKNNKHYTYIVISDDKVQVLTGEHEILYNTGE